MATPPHITAHPNRIAAVISSSEAELSSSSISDIESVQGDLVVTPTEASTAATPAVHMPRVQMILVQLLQRAAHTPEELLLFVSELAAAGLLSTEVITGLCASLGVGGELLQAILSGRRGESAVTTAAAAAEPTSPSRQRQALAVAPFGAVVAPGVASAPAPAPFAGAGGAAPVLSGLAADLRSPGPSVTAAVNPLPSPYTAAAFGLSGLSIPLDQTLAGGMGGGGVRDRLSSEFVLLQKIGQGGGGCVYRARHALDGREYALKQVAFSIRPAAPDHETAERVAREVLALARLHHPHICRYYTAWLQTDWASMRPAHAHGVAHAHGGGAHARNAGGAATTALAPAGFAPPLMPTAWPPLLTMRQDSRDGGDGGGARAERWSQRSEGSDGGEWSGDDDPSQWSASSVSELSRGTFGEAWSGSGVGGDSGDESFSKHEHVRKGAKGAKGAKGGAGGGGGGGASTSVAAAAQAWSYRKLLLIQMELCDGPTLRTFLRRRDAAGDPVDWSVSIDLMQQLTSGLAHVHEQGLVHRDLKPTNCCFSGGVLKLIDFGLAKPTISSSDGGGGGGVSVSGGGGGVGAEQIPVYETGAGAGGGGGAGKKTNGPHRLVQRGDVAANGDGVHSFGVGTPSYAAPEQLSDHAALIPLSASCDIFPLALIGFELFRSFGSAMERAKLFGELRSVGAPTAPPPAVTKRKGGGGGGAAKGGGGGGGGSGSGGGSDGRRADTTQMPPCLAPPHLPPQLAPLLATMLQHEPSRRPLCPTVMRQLMVCRQAIEATAVPPTPSPTNSTSVPSEMEAGVEAGAGRGSAAGRRSSGADFNGEDSPLFMPALHEMGSSPQTSPPSGASTPAPTPDATPSTKLSVPLLGGIMGLPPLQLPPASSSPGSTAVPAEATLAALSERDATVARQRLEHSILAAELRREEEERR